MRGVLPHPTPTEEIFKAKEVHTSYLEAHNYDREISRRIGNIEYMPRTQFGILVVNWGSNPRHVSTRVDILVLDVGQCCARFVTCRRGDGSGSDGVALETQVLWRQGGHVVTDGTEPRASGD